MKLLLRERLTFLSRVPGLLVYICFIIVDVMTDACTMFLNFIAVKLFRKYFYIDIILHIYIFNIYFYIFVIDSLFILYIYFFCKFILSFPSFNIQTLVSFCIDVRVVLEDVSISFSLLTVTKAIP